MSNFSQIEDKLQQFIKKYYTNELIKGSILFFAIGLLYFFVTILIEHFLWLKPTARTVLFALFILVELGLLIFYIIIPCTKIWGIRKGINEFDAAILIGNHFPEVSDKLLNMIQLNEVSKNSELIKASIDLRSSELNVVPFKRAIDFRKNKKYLKYAFIPIVIWLLVLLTGKITVFNNSLTRVVHYNNQYEAPAPFSFVILNNSFDVIEGEPFSLKIATEGSVIPNDAIIYFNNENYYLKNNGGGEFEYQFSKVINDVDFFVEANGVQSKIYHLNMLETPSINSLSMVLNYPKYTGKINEVVKNTGNAVVPQGTSITWQVETKQTDEVSILLKEEKIDFIKSTNNYFTFNKIIRNSIGYSVTTSNKKLKNYEALSFGIEVVKDEFPKINISSNIDSIASGPAQFVGQVSDDYAVKKLELVYYDKSEPNSVKVLNLDISNSTISDFYYVFPDRLELNPGLDYEFYFQVFDNDGVNGSKSSKSRSFSYYNKTQEERNDDGLKAQRESLSKVSKSIEKSKKNNSELEEFKKNVQKKADVNWNDKKKLEEFIKRQNQYQEMFDKQTNDLQKNLEEQEVGENLEEKKEELEKRIEESKKIANQEKLLEELNKLSEKLEKEDLVDKLEEIAKKNKNKEQSLERILELTKRFYVEQKANQISEKLLKLSEELLNFDKIENNKSDAEKQDGINKEFKNIEEEIKKLKEDNKKLKRPMKLPQEDEKVEDVENDLNKALDNIEKGDKGSSKKNQKSAAKKMKEMSSSMETSMMSMNGESIDENIEDLRNIVENLIEFSFQQEDLMKSFSNNDNGTAEFPKNLKKQFVLKEYFEHIDDSLYMLSLRLVKMGENIRTEVSNVHFNIDKSLENFSENLFENGISNQKFVINSANILANHLSDLLESLMNASANMGKGSGNSPEFSLPDIIKKQGELSEKMEEGKEKGEKKGKENEGDKRGEDGEGKTGGDGLSNETMNEELFEIYKQQVQLREMLKSLMKGDSKNSKKVGDVLKSMEELENELLEQGYSNDVIEKMQQLNYELLKLEKAKKEQGKDVDRKSDMNRLDYKQRQIDDLKLQKPSFNYNEILNRQSLPLRSIYKNKVQEYFKTTE